MSDQLLHEAVAAALRRPLTSEETAEVNRLEVGARALVRGHLGCEPPKEAEETVRYVLSQMIVRALKGPQDDSIGLSSRTVQAGAFQVAQGISEGAQGGGVWLTRQDRIMLRPWACPMASVPLVSERP